MKFNSFCFYFGFSFLLLQNHTPTPPLLSSLIVFFWLFLRRKTSRNKNWCEPTPSIRRFLFNAKSFKSVPSAVATFTSAHQQYLRLADEKSRTSMKFMSSHPQNCFHSFSGPIWMHKIYIPHRVHDKIYWTERASWSLLAGFHFISSLFVYTKHGANGRYIEWLAVFVVCRQSTQTENPNPYVMLPSCVNGKWPNRVEIDVQWAHMAHLDHQKMCENWRVNSKWENVLEERSFHFW